VSLPVVIAVGVLGGAGAIARFLVDSAVSRRAGRAFPFGILAVNLSGAFALGVLAGRALHGDADLLAAGGLIGAYTTFSTWVFDSERLGEEGRPRAAALNLAGSLVLGLAAVWLGRTAGHAL
jgi:fluoride exporter